MKLERVSPENWNKVAEEAHLTCFSELRPKSRNTIDYAILVHDEEKPCAYATIIEMDQMSAYMQHGGAFPETKGTAKSFRSYQMIIDHLSEFYQALTTRIENTNVPMLKFALSVGFLPIGMDCHTFGIYEGTFLHMYRDNKKETIHV